MNPALYNIINFLARIAVERYLTESQLENNSAAKDSKPEETEFTQPWVDTSADVATFNLPIERKET